VTQVRFVTIRGSVPYDVEQQIRDLVTGHNQLDAQVQALPNTGEFANQIAQLQQTNNDLLARLAALESQVKALQAQVDALPP
jgi:hypothetical protein